jgi:NAD(P)-dependent dehydrogenase (short-subunit alcohol dehydrogenase family)
VSRFALVTGAAGDLGRAAALRLADDGWSLFLADHPSAAERLEATRDECVRSGADAVPVGFDVTDAAAVEFNIEALAARHGAPAALVASAGVQGEFAPVQEYESASLRRLLDVNVIGVFNCLNAVARLLIGGRSEGSLVALASMAGVNGAPNMPAYSASKAAVIGLVKSAARDLAPHGIRVNAVSPGFIGPGAMWDNQVAQQAAVRSKYFADEPDAVARQMVGSVPLGRYGSAREVADVISYLVGDRSSYLTGINIEVSGGAF